MKIGFFSEPVIIAVEFQRMTEKLGTNKPILVKKNKHFNVIVSHTKHLIPSKAEKI